MQHIEEMDDDLDSQPTVNDKKIYIPMNVLDAAKKRISLIFDQFDKVCVSVSGGKDSQVTFELAYAEARNRHRDLHVFFLDQEAEYQATINVVREEINRAGVIPHWYQVPLRMTNATSYEEEFLVAWEEGKQWMREKEPNSIHSAPSAPDRFYGFMEWFEGEMAGACFLVGLRSEESLNRFGAVTRNPAIEGMNWTSKGNKGTVRAYPIYDWTFEDIWTLLGSEKIKYNRIYDYLWAKNVGINEFRVSFLLHEKSFQSMATLQEFEPDTYQKIIERIGGAHTAALYAKEQTVYRAGKLPKAFKTWLAYRDFLVEEMPEHRRETFKKRFANQAQTETVYKQQVRQMLINDWENNTPVINMPDKEDPRKKWMEIL